MNNKYYSYMSANKNFINTSLITSNKSKKLRGEVYTSLMGFFKVVVILVVLVGIGSFLLRAFKPSVSSTVSSVPSTTKPSVLKYASRQGMPPYGATSASVPPDAWWLPARDSWWYWDWLYDPYYDYYWRTWYPEYHHHHHHYPTSAPTSAPTAAIPTDAPVMPTISPEPTLAGMNILPTGVEPTMIDFALPTLGGNSLPTMPSAASLNMPSTLDAPDIIISEPTIGNFLPTMPALNIPNLTLTQPESPLPPAMNQPVLPPAGNLGAKEGFVNNPSCLLNMKPLWNIKDYIKDNTNAKPKPSEYSTTNYEKSNW